MSLTANLADQVTAAEGESDYVAVELLWNVLVKAAHSQSESDEFRRLKQLVTGLTDAQAAAVVQHASVDLLLNLDPPLETVLAGPHERLDAKAAASEVVTIRATRASEPRKAITALLSTLKRIRNKRSTDSKPRMDHATARFWALPVRSCSYSVVHSFIDDPVLGIFQYLIPQSTRSSVNRLGVS